MAEKLRKFVSNAGGDKAYKASMADDKEEEEEEEDEEEEEEEEEDDDDMLPEDFEFRLREFAQNPIPVKVHDLKIEGNYKTRAFVIESQFDRLRDVATSQDLLREASYAVTRLERMGIFEECTLSLENGPVRGSVNVVVSVEERSNPRTFDLGSFIKYEDKESSLEGRFEWKNLLGFGETWDGIGRYGLDKDLEMSGGLYFPRLKSLTAFLRTQATLFTQDQLHLSPYKLRLAGVTIGLLSGKHQDLSFSLNWHMPRNSGFSGGTVGLLPSIKYAFTLDKRDSVSRPTTGYALRLATHLSGAGFDTAQYSARQDIDFRYAVPLRFYNAAVNIGMSAGFMLPWTKGFSMNSSDTSHNVFMGKRSSLVCDMNGPISILNLCDRGVQSKEEEKNQNGTKDGCLALAGFADLAFDLPLGPFRRENMYGHCFLGTANLFRPSGLGGNTLSFQDYLSTFKCVAGAGIVVPTRICRLEVNFCQVWNSFRSSSGKGGIQLSFSSHH